MESKGKITVNAHNAKCITDMTLLTPTIANAVLSSLNEVLAEVIKPNVYYVSRQVGGKTISVPAINVKIHDGGLFNIESPVGIENDIHHGFNQLALAIMQLTDNLGMELGFDCVVHHNCRVSYLYTQDTVLENPKHTFTVQCAGAKFGTFAKNLTNNLANS